MGPLRTILVHVDSSSRCTARLKLAHELAVRHDAAVTALFAATPAELLMPYGDVPEFPLGSFRLDFEINRRQRARALFDAAKGAGMTRLQWAELRRDEPLRAFSMHALYADLLVLGQREPPVDTLPDVPADFVESTLSDCGTPAIVVPYIGAPASLAQTVLVAWKETRESARALVGALPLLQSAREVHVVLWSDAGMDAAAAESPIEACLRSHGVAPVMHRYGQAARDVGDLLLSVAADRGADLIVMGCYGHARAREWILGGASRVVLKSMTVPVLMAH